MRKFFSLPYWTHCLFGLLLIFSPAWSDLKDLSEFSGITILDQGRKKPLDSYARHVLLTFSGKSSYEKRPAIKILAEIIFTPDSTKDYKIFMVNSMEAVQAMGLDLAQARRFSYSQLEPGIEKLRTLASEISKIDEKEQTLVQKEILKLFHNLNSYVTLASSFQFAIPNDIYSIRNADLAAYLKMDPHPAEYAYFDILSKASDLHKFLSAMQTSKDTSLTDLDREVVRLSQEMFTWARYYAGMPIPIIPVADSGKEEKWYSPWNMLSNFYHHKGLTEEIGHLAALTKAYLAGDQQAFNESALAFKSLIEENIQGKVDLGRNDLELTYNRAQPFLWSKVLYVISFLLILLSYSFWSRPLYLASWAALLLGFLPHTWGIISRMIIMHRPPVTNLFETFLFVAWISVLVSALGEWIQKKGTGTITATFSGFALLMVAQKYSLDGDTLGMLVAVLDSNFWLATHVVTITMGYAGCCAAGVAGHIYLIQCIFKADKEKLKDTFKSIYGILAFGLIFSFIGTVLGGIWADQSWGRFWGWDPKENGALLIVLWCSVLFHARMGGMIREVGFAAGTVLGGIIVMFAWFGVNLLGVGLHSYGFSSGVFLKLFIYYGVEILFVLVAVGIIRLKKA